MEPLIIAILAVLILLALIPHRPDPTVIVVTRQPWDGLDAPESGCLSLCVLGLLALLALALLTSTPS